MIEHLVYISPHLDDAIFSCGGLIFEQVRAGIKVEIWTITGASPDPNNLPEFAKVLHKRWGIKTEATSSRRAEDLKACEIVGAIPMHLNWLDCIYRFKNNGDALIKEDDDLFVKSPEKTLVNEIGKYLATHIPEDAQIITPIGLGGHIDHRLTCQAVSASGLDGSFYADYPYVTYDFKNNPQLESTQWSRVPQVISEDGLKAWQKAVLAYTSQLSTFWKNKAEVQLAINNFYGGGGGRLWKNNPIVS
ncbi:MAG: PIG-L family deacetylase [Anaerolineaceae bacterium]|nr:PIG-L family deacetylase [Anaerolineaceae bacterium]